MLFVLGDMVWGGHNSFLVPTVREIPGGSVLAAGLAERCLGRGLSEIGGGQ